MFKKLNLKITAKFFIPVAVVLAVIIFLFIFFANKNLEALLLKRAETFIADHTKIDALHLLNSSDFTFVDSASTELKFVSFADKMKIPDILRIKVWDKNGRIIFSDDKSIVGKLFLDNEEYNEAIKGSVEAEIKYPAKKESMSERGYGRLLEVYVPIQFDGETKPVGVIETYYRLDDVYKALNETRIKIFFTGAAGFLVILLFFIILFKNLIKTPLMKINRSMEGVAKDGNLNKNSEPHSKDEVGTLIVSFNKMVDRLKFNEDGLKKANAELEYKVKERSGPYEEKIKEQEERIAELEKIRNNLEEKLKNYL